MSSDGELDDAFDCEDVTEGELNYAFDCFDYEDINDGQENEDYENVIDGQENEDYEDATEGEFYDLIDCEDVTEGEFCDPLDCEDINNGQANEGYEDISDYEENEGQLANNKHGKSALQELCLKCITENFDTFNTAYSTSQDPILRRNLEFLQRVYSSYFIKSVTDREGRFEDKYLDFLINQYLKELDVGILIHCCWESVIKRMAQVGHGFEKISFEIPHRFAAQNIVHFVNIIVCSLTNVDILHIPLHCNDETLKIISSSCPKLKELYIDGSVAITNKGLEVLSPDHEVPAKLLLKVLSLINTEIGESGISFLLKNISSLEVLHHNNLPFILYLMHRENLQNNSLAGVKKYNLTMFNFHNIISLYFDDALSIFTKVCPNIKTLSVQIQKDEHLKLISQLSELECLDVEYASFREPHRDINNFLKSNGQKLRKLQISCFALSISVLIQNCSKLESLALKSITFQLMEENTKMLNYLKELCLERLSFAESCVEESVNAILQYNPKLETISMENCNFENSEMDTILAKYCENSLLQHLKFNHCDIDEPLLASIILTCSTLQTLTIHCCYNIMYDQMHRLNDLVESTKHIVEIFWTFDDMYSV